MAINAEWILPVGLGILGTILFFLNRNAQAVPVRIKKNQTRRR